MSDEEALQRLLGDEWARAAAAQRGVARRLREQAAEERTLAGVLLDAAESGLPVVVRTTAGRAHQGDVRGVGADFCALRMRSGRWAYLALAAVGWVRVETGAPNEGARGEAVQPGPRGEAVDRTLAEVLDYLAPERPRATVRTGSDPEALAGELQAVGVDVATLRLDGPTPRTCHVRVGAISEVIIERG